MNKLKKDMMIFYMFRNGIVTFLITIFTFLINISNYYQTTIEYTLQKIFFDNVYTIMYFLLLWILNYLLVEIYKMMYDMYYGKWVITRTFSNVLGKTKTYRIDLMVIVAFVIPIGILIFCLLSDQGLFTLDGIFLSIFMLASTCIDVYKKRKIDD